VFVAEVSSSKTVSSLEVGGSWFKKGEEEEDVEADLKG
jgi:hypothetical protein